jgi:hypothetical protein
VQSSKCDKYTPQMLNNRKAKEEEEVEEEEDGELRTALLDNRKALPFLALLMAVFLA